VSLPAGNLVVELDCLESLGLGAGVPRHHLAVLGFLTPFLPAHLEIRTKAMKFGVAFEIGQLAVVLSDLPSRREKLRRHNCQKRTRHRLLIGRQKMVEARYLLQRYLLQRYLLRYF
jgi:hypothetical protein